MKPKTLSIKGLSAKRPIDYGSLIAYTDRSKKTSMPIASKEDNSKRHPLTARETIKSTKNITRPKDSEYIVSSQNKSSGLGINSPKKLNPTSTDGMYLSRKKFSLESSNQLTTAEERPNTGRQNTSTAYGVISGPFSKKSTITSRLVEDHGLSKDKKPTQHMDKQSTGSQSSRTYKTVVEHGALFSSIKSEYNRKVSATQLGKIPEVTKGLIAMTSEGLSARSNKTNMGNPGLRKNKLSLRCDIVNEGNFTADRGSLTDRRLYKDKKIVLGSQNANALVDMDSPTLVQDSRFIKHLKHQNKSKDSSLKTAGSSSGQNLIKKKIEISTGRSRVKSNKISVENLRLEYSRKSAAAISEYGQPEHQHSKINTNLNTIKIERGKSKSLLSEFNAKIYRKDSDSDKQRSTITGNIARGDKTKTEKS